MDYSQLASDVVSATMAMKRSNFWNKKTSAFLHGEMFILNHIICQEQGVLPGELSSAMNASTARIAMALKNLEKKGYVKRSIDPDDRRKINVTITEIGRKLVIDERRKMLGKIESILRELGEQDTKEYIRIVNRITQIASAIDQQD